MILKLLKLLKHLFSPKCDHVPNMEDNKEFVCKKCNVPLTHINYTPGGIGTTDDYFSWSIGRDLENPESPLSKVAADINIEERLRILKEQVVNQVKT